MSFTGCIDARGFNRGRVRAVLRRKRNRPGNEGVSGAECIGYSPHARQKLNIGDKFHQTPGTIVIQHCPRRVPLSSGVLEVEVTALGPTKYSVVVVSGQCELCTSLVDKRSAEATNLQVSQARTASTVSAQCEPMITIPRTMYGGMDVTKNVSTYPTPMTYPYDQSRAW